LFFNFNIFDFDFDVNSFFNKRCYKKNRDRNVINIVFNENFNNFNKLEIKNRIDKKIYQIIFTVELKYNDDENNENVDLNKN
jgi:hypothetical protein